MEFKNLIESRRSIRKYAEGVTISNDELKEMAAASLNAPSWKNTETARFYFVNGDKLSDFAAKCLPSFNQANTINCAAYVVTTYVMGQSGYATEGHLANEIGEAWGAYDLGLNNMIFTLKAKEMGYDTLIMGIRDTDAIKSYFNIANNEAIVAVIGLGKAAAPVNKPKRKAVDEVVKFA